MKLYSTTNPTVIVSPALGTEEEMEAFVDKLIEVSKIRDVKAETVLMHEGREDLPRAWFY